MAIYFKGPNAEEAKKLIAELKAIRRELDSVDYLMAPGMFASLEARHHEIAMRLQELDRSE